MLQAGVKGCAVPSAVLQINRTVKRRQQQQQQQRTCSSIHISLALLAFDTGGCAAEFSTSGAWPIFRVKWQACRTAVCA